LVFLGEKHYLLWWREKHHLFLADPTSDYDNAYSASASFGWLLLIPSWGLDRIVLICAHFAFVIALCGPLKWSSHLFDLFLMCCNHLYIILVYVGSIVEKPILFFVLRIIHFFFLSNKENEWSFSVLFSYSIIKKKKTKKIEVGERNRGIFSTVDLDRRKKEEEELETFSDTKFEAAYFTVYVVDTKIGTPSSNKQQVLANISNDGKKEWKMLNLQHQYKNCTTIPHMRVGPTYWGPPSCEGLLYNCCIGVVQ
jgi:hypothetical protein